MKEYVFQRIFSGEDTASDNDKSRNDFDEDNVNCEDDDRGSYSEASISKIAENPECEF